MNDPRGLSKLDSGEWKYLHSVEEAKQIDEAFQKFPVGTKWKKECAPHSSGYEVAEIYAHFHSMLVCIIKGYTSGGKLHDIDMKDFWLIDRTIDFGDKMEIGRNACDKYKDALTLLTKHPTLTTETARQIAFRALDGEDFSKHLKDKS